MGSNSETDASQRRSSGSDTPARFPKWAPSGLVQYYAQKSAELEADRTGGRGWIVKKKEIETKDKIEAIYEWDPELIFALQEIDVCELLLRPRQELEAVWTSLSEKEKWNDEKLRKMVREIVAEMVEYPRRTHRAPQTHRRELEKVAKKARELRDLVVECGDDLTPAGFAQIAARLEVRPLENWLRSQGIEGKTAKRIALGIPKWVRDESHGYEHATTFGDALEYLADLADKRAANPPVIGKPTAKRAAVFSLGVRLTEFFRELFGTRLISNAAALASAAYRTTITEDDLKKFIRSSEDRTERASSAGTKITK